jgi:hypothetical protein
MMAHIATNSALADAEIEITPEMIEAGAAVIASYDRRFSCPEGASEEVFRAMLSVSRKRSEI